MERCVSSFIRQSSWHRSETHCSIQEESRMSLLFHIHHWSLWSSARDHHLLPWSTWSTQSKYSSSLVVVHQQSSSRSRSTFLQCIGGIFTFELWNLCSKKDEESSDSRSSWLWSSSWIIVQSNLEFNIGNILLCTIHRSSIEDFRTSVVFLASGIENHHRHEWLFTFRTSLAFSLWRTEWTWSTKIVVEMVRRWTSRQRQMSNTHHSMTFSTWSFWTVWREGNHFLWKCVEKRNRSEWNSFFRLSIFLRFRLNKHPGALYSLLISVDAIRSRVTNNAYVSNCPSFVRLERINRQRNQTFEQIELATAVQCRLPFVLSLSLRMRSKFAFLLSSECHWNEKIKSKSTMM